MVNRDKGDLEEEKRMLGARKKIWENPVGCIDMVNRDKADI